MTSQFTPPNTTSAHQPGSQIVLFQDKEIRRAQHDGEWNFSIIDVIEVLTDSPNPRRYWSDLKRKLLEEEGFSELYENIVQLKMKASDGKSRTTDAVSIKTLLRIVQSVPSPKAERFKRWLADVGYERIQEEQDPERAIHRAINTYQRRGHDDAWIKARLEGIKGRRALTDEWEARGIDGFQYGKLTNVVAKETFGLVPKQHQELKGLGKNDNLRDHMTEIELILATLSEKSTVMLARNRDAQGYSANEAAACEGGQIAGNARRDLEKRLGHSVVSNENYLPDIRKKQGKLPNS